MFLKTSKSLATYRRCSHAALFNQRLDAGYSVGRCWPLDRNPAFQFFFSATDGQRTTLHGYQHVAAIGVGEPARQSRTLDKKILGLIRFPKQLPRRFSQG